MNLTIPTIASISAGATRITSGEVVLSNSNGLSFGANGQTITGAHNALTVGIQSISAGGADVTSGRVIFSNSNGVSFGANGQTVTASVDAGGGGVTMSGYNPFDRREMLNQPGQIASLVLQPLSLGAAVQFDRVVMPVFVSNPTNSTGSHSFTISFGIYTRNVSTLSQLISTSMSTAITLSGTVASYSLYSNMRLSTVGLTTTLTHGEYVIGINFSSLSAGQNCSYSLFYISAQPAAVQHFGHFGVAPASSVQPVLGQGVYTSTTTALPVSIPYASIDGSRTVGLRQVFFHFASGTI
jgi:hypothetical protein